MKVWMLSQSGKIRVNGRSILDNNFWGQPKGERAGTEIRLDREFDWAGYHWVIPAVYACEKGIVMEFCRRVEVEDIRDFMKKVEPERGK